MRKTVEREPTITQKMVEILLAQPDLKAANAVAAMNRQFGITPSDTVYYHARKWIKEHSTLPGTLPSARQGTNGSIAPPTPAITVPDLEEITEPKPVDDAGSSFVPSALLLNIRHIKQACDESGGLDVATRVAEVINQAGGVANFLSAIELLKQISETRQILPSDVNARL